MHVSQADRAAIILAGGDGSRLGEYIRQLAGRRVPKQFFPLLGGASLLERTRCRVSLSVASGRTYFLLNREHETLFSPLLADVNPKNLITQPANRGTAPAILYALLRLAETMPQASLVLMPSDHHVSNETRLMEHVDEAFEIVESRPELTVLLGAAPDEPETAYGWIEPGPALKSAEQTLFDVRHFWEKPSREIARQLMANGCLWNTFIIVARLSTLLGLFIAAMPDLYLSFSRIRPSLGTSFEGGVVRRLYQDLRSSDFSRQVLEHAMNLCVLQMSDVGWSDLGDPCRVAKVLGALQLHHKSDAA
jgi:mannose-1-phosphate guanylyltransferase